MRRPAGTALLAALLALAPTVRADAHVAGTVVAEGGEAEVADGVADGGDRDAARLDALFEALGSASTPAEATRLEASIWRAWLDAPDEDASILMDAVQGAMAAGEGERALDLADRLVALAPDWAEGWNKRATILYVLGDDDASVADIRETLAREPRHFGAISGLGQIFLRRGEPARALEAFEAVLELSPASPNARAAVEFARAAADERRI